MTETNHIDGRCLCGAVTVRALRGRPNLRACHCDMCRRWSSSMYMSLPTEPGSVEVAGPVKTFKSSDWAERAFCGTCGSSLWYMTRHDQRHQLAAGLFENAAGNLMYIEFFGDRRPDGYALAGDHQRLSDAETLALFAPKED